MAARVPPAAWVRRAAPPNNRSQDEAGLEGSDAHCSAASTALTWVDLVSSFIARDHAGTVHDDFRMVERGEAVDNAPLLRVRGVLRVAWTLPTDTFVTLDLPVLLTRVCHRTDAYQQRAWLGSLLEPTGQKPRATC